jgi:hypothetical protein
MIQGAVLGLIALALVASVASAGSIRGQVIAPPPAVSASLERRPGKSPQQEPVVVFIQELPEPVEAQLARRSRTWRIIQSRRQFRPEIFAIAVGDSLIIQNQDRMFHGAYGIMSDYIQDFGKNPPNHFIGVRLRKIGPMRLQCDIHPFMSANVFVTPNHAFTISKSSGSFSLPKVPAPGRGSARVTLRF